MQSVVPTFQHHLVENLERRSSAIDPRSLGLNLSDPDGFLRLDQVTLATGEAVISRVSSTGYKGTMRDDSYFTFVLQRSGRYDVQISGQDFGMSPGSLSAFRPNERRTRVLAGKTGTRDAATLQLPIARMNELAQAMDSTADTAIPRDGLTFHGEGGRTLARILPQLADALFLRPAVPLPPRVAQEIKHLIDEVVCELIGRVVERPASRRIFPAFYRVRQAEEMIRSQSDDPVSILEIARTLGVSLRSLQLAFNEVHDGQSARVYLNRIRLEKARQRLLAAKGDGEVTTIALDSGFFHLSRFAQAYARTFGERPSETLARRRAWRA